MTVVGLTGGIGSGKSTALRVFKKLGAFTIDADQLARDAVNPGREAWLDIKECFGKKFFFKNHKLNRKKLAAHVFKNKKTLKKLVDIIHPRVFEEEKRLISFYSKKKKRALIVVDAPMMIESNSHKWKDILVVMNCSRENQIKRILKSGKLEKTEIEKRIKAQMPLSKKLKYADYVIDNNGTALECRQNSKKVYQEIIAKQS